MEAWPVGSFATSEWLYGRYKEWASDHEVNPNCRSDRYFTRMIDLLRSDGLMSEQVRRAMDDGRKRRGYVRLQPGLCEHFDKVSDLPVAGPSLKPGSVMVQAMRDRISATRKAPPDDE